MATCDFCGTTILLGGVRDGQLRFCNEDCHQQFYLTAVLDRFPEEFVAEQVEQIHAGNCPKCGRPGPVDVHTSHAVYSLLVFTSYRSRPEICCRRCGIKAKLGGMASSAVLGWWGFPWGVVLTPVQILRNMFGLIRSPNPTMPSEQLEGMVKIQLAAQFLEDRASMKAVE